MLLRLFCLALLGSISTTTAGEVQHVNEQTFNQEISSGIVLVDFYGPWCGPCKALSPVLDDLSETLPAGMKIVKVNIDQSKTLANQYNVRAVPTLVLFKDGKEVDRLKGARSKQRLEQFMYSARN